MASPEHRSWSERLRTPTPWHVIPIWFLLAVSAILPSSTEVLLWRVWACRIFYFQHNRNIDIPNRDAHLNPLCNIPEVDAVLAMVMTALYAIIGTLCMMIVPLFAGAMRKHGRRPAILLCATAATISTVCIGLSIWLESGPHAVVLVLISLVTTPLAAEDLSELALKTYTVDTTSLDIRAPWFGVMMGIKWATMALGSWIGGALGVRTNFLLAPYVASAVVGCVGILYTAFLLPESLPREKRESLAAERQATSPTETHSKTRTCLHPRLAMFLRPILALLPSYHLPLRSKSSGHRKNYIPLLLGLTEFLIGVAVVYASQLLLMKAISNRFGWNQEDIGAYIGLMLGLRSIFLIVVFPPMVVWLKAPSTPKPVLDNAVAEGTAPVEDAIETTPLLPNDHDSSSGSAITRTTIRGNSVDLKLAVVGSLCGVVVLWLWGLAQGGLVLYLSLGVFSVAGMAAPSITSYATASVEPDKVDDVIAGFVMVSTLGASLSAPILGSIYSLTATTIPDTAFFVAGA